MYLPMTAYVASKSCWKLIASVGIALFYIVDSHPQTVLKYCDKYCLGGHLCSYIKNKNEPSTVPCRTPEVTQIGED